MDSFWDILLAEQLGQLRRVRNSLRVAVLGIGHELRGDDAAGVLIAKHLQALLGDAEDRLILYAGPAPENFCGAFRRFAPDLVLMIDAAQMDAVPGTVRLIPFEDVAGIGPSTHTLPLHLLAGYLASELGCEVVLLGIQPAKVEYGEVSAPMQKIIPSVAKKLAIALGGELVDEPFRKQGAMKTNAAAFVPTSVQVLAAKPEQGTT